MKLWINASALISSGGLVDSKPRFLHWTWETVSSNWEIPKYNKSDERSKKPELQVMIQNPKLILKRSKLKEKQYLR